VAREWNVNDPLDRRRISKDFTTEVAELIAADEAQPTEDRQLTVFETAVLKLLGSIALGLWRE
jgi:hypothetical protein